MNKETGAYLLGTRYAHAVIKSKDINGLFYALKSAYMAGFKECSSQVQKLTAAIPLLERKPRDE